LLLRAPPLTKAAKKAYAQAKQQSKRTQLLFARTFQLRRKALVDAPAVGSSRRRKAAAAAAAAAGDPAQDEPEMPVLQAAPTAEEDEVAGLHSCYRSIRALEKSPFVRQTRKSRCCRVWFRNRCTF